MKNIVPACILASGIFLAGCAAHVVTRRPADVVYARSLSPGPGWVWVSGDWVWGGGRYQWREGYWHPPRPGYKWTR
ncbi:MAG TPA: hypothetical protein DIC22_00040, partial [Chitinophagaceae bacterium]|nr:hypothetical protein [Chitinophagaceae bacterium]